MNKLVAAGLFSLIVAPQWPEQAIASTLKAAEIIPNWLSLFG